METPDDQLAFATEEKAKEYSAEVASLKGCSGSTLYWYAWAQGPDGLWYCPPLPDTPSPEGE